MRTNEQCEHALACLSLALSYSELLEGPPLDNAAAFFAFVTGWPADDAKAKLDAVRKVVSCP